MSNKHSTHTTARQERHRTPDSQNNIYGTNWISRAYDQTMRLGLIDRFSKSDTATVVALIADFSAVLSIAGSDSIRSWLRDNYLIVSIVCLLSVAATLLLLNHYPKTVRSLRDDIENKQAIIDQPTRRDADAFSSILEELPMGTGLMGTLAVVFVGKDWEKDDVVAARQFVSRWREHFFDDGVVDHSFRDLWKTCDDLLAWMGREGERFGPAEDGKFQMYRTITATYRSGGYEEYSTVVEQGGELGDKLLEARRNFERSGRGRGL